MSLTYAIDTRQQVVITTARDSLTDADLLAYFIILRNDPAFQPYYAHLSDYRAVREAHITGAGIRIMVARTPFLLTTRRAFVVTNETTYGVVSMMRLVARLDPKHTEVFHTLKDAYTWLGITMLNDGYAWHHQASSVG